MRNLIDFYKYSTIGDSINVYITKPNKCGVIFAKFEKPHAALGMLKLYVNINKMEIVRNMGFDKSQMAMDFCKNNASLMTFIAGEV